MATFSSPTDVVAGALAKSSDLNNLDAATAAAFALLPTNAGINAGTVSFAVDTGTANAYLVALPMTATSYGDGLQVVMRPLYANTGACTINVDSLGVKSIKTEANTVPAANDIVAGVPVELRYSTSTGYFHIIKNSAAQATAAAASAAAAVVSAAAALASEGAAAGSQSAAAASAAAALVSENATAALYDSFDDRYLGAKASDPTLDNDGNALITGAMYFNTTSSLMKVYSGAAWLVIGASEAAGDGIDVTYAAGQVTISVDLKANGGLVIEATEIAVDLGASSITGTLAVGDGGTGRTTSTTAYGLLAAGTTATGAHQTLAAGLATQILVGGGASALPAWGTDIPTAVTIGAAYIYRAAGTDIPVTDGGTGVSTLTTAYGLLAAGTTATGVVQTLSAGLTTQILVGGGVSTLPAWGTDIPTAVTIGSAYIYRASGTDVPVADGGTGVSTFALNGVLFGNAASAIGVTAIGAAGQLLKVGASPFVPAWSTLVLTEGANTFNLAAGTASLDVAAGAAVNVDANLTVTAATSLDEAVAMSSKLTGSYATAAEILAGTEAAKAIAPDQAALSLLTYEVDALMKYGGGIAFTQATIEAALNIIGTVNKVTLLIRPGNWVILTALAFPANVTVKMPPGAYFSGAAVTAGTVTFADDQSIYPSWFNAKGDGSTDDKAALKAAAAATPAGGTLIIPKTSSYYKFDNSGGLSDAVAITQAITIQLDGTIKSTSSTNGANPPYIFNVTGDGFILKGAGTLQGPGTFVNNETTFANVPGLLRLAANNAAVDGITFLDPPEAAIAIPNRTNIKIINNKFTGGPLVAGCGAQLYYILAYGGNQHIISGNKFYASAIGGAMAQGMDYGSAVVGENIIITNNQFTDIHEHAMYLIVNNSIISNNIIKYSQAAVDQQGNALKVGGVHNIVTGNQIYNAAKGGITAYAATDTIIAHNSIFDFGSVGIEVTSNVADTIGFNRNIIDSNNLYGRTDGVSVLGGIEYVGQADTTANCYSGKITNNIVQGAGTTTASRSPISVYHVNASYGMIDFEISGNKIVFPKQNAFYLVNMNSATIKGNTVYNPVTAASRIFFLSKVTNSTISGNIARDYQVAAKIDLFLVVSGTDNLNIDVIDNAIFTTGAVAALGDSATYNVKCKRTRIGASEASAGYFEEIPISMITGDATPTVWQKNVLLSLGTTTITNFDDGVPGQRITFIAESSITITDGTNIFLNGSANWAMTATDTLTLICKADGKWYEISRGDDDSCLTGGAVATTYSIPATIFSVAMAGLYVVGVWLSGGSNTAFHATATIISDGDTASILNYAHGAWTTITLSGTNVQVTTDTGIAIWKCVKIN